MRLSLTLSMPLTSTNKFHFLLEDVGFLQDPSECERSEAVIVDFLLTFEVEQGNMTGSAKLELQVLLLFDLCGLFSTLSLSGRMVETHKLSAVSMIVGMHLSLCCKGLFSRKNTLELDEILLIQTDSHLGALSSFKVSGILLDLISIRSCLFCEILGPLVCLEHLEGVLLLLL